MANIESNWFRPNGSTRGLKAGDIVVYDDHNKNFKAKVIKVTSSQKAQIKPLTDVDDTFNTSNIINTYRSFMKISN